MKRITIQAKKIFTIVKKGSMFVLMKKKTVIGKFESYVGAYKAREREFRKQAA